MATVDSIKLFDMKNSGHPGWVSVDTLTSGSGYIGFSVDGSDTLESHYVDENTIGVGTQFNFGTTHQTHRVCAYPLDQPLLAKCASIEINIPPPPPPGTDIIINSINIVKEKDLGWISVTVNTSGSGTFGLAVNGVEKQTGNEYTDTITFFVGSSGTFNICAYSVKDKLNTTKCQSVTITSGGSGQDDLIKAIIVLIIGYFIIKEGK